MEELQKKILENFSGKVVRKDLAFLVKGGLPVPTYVLEYLLAQYCATDNQEIIDEGIEKVKTIIRNNYVNRAEAEQIKGKIRECGRFSVIDKITVVLDDKKDMYRAMFANLDLQNIPIASDMVVHNPKLLSGNGVWSIVTINYLSGDDIPVRWEVEKLKPVQISRIDVAEYIGLRKNFTTEEWIDFLIHTVGLNPEMLNRREKLITLARLLPHVENNFNFMELGPKGTGKSHVFQELSPYGVLVSGGDVTSARLFVKMSGNREILGLVGYWDIVAWDEFEQQKGRSVDAVLIDTMQNYLANKSFNRGKATHEASASMVFVGNTKHTVPYMLKNSHLFESIPTAFIKGAFLDRIHLYNPGWEIKMLKKDSFSKGYGLITDYIAAVLHDMRNLDWTSKLKDYAKFDGSLSERDHLAIRKTFSGMMKLLYPDGVLTDEEAYELVDFAAEGRKRVKDQLYIIDETFKAEPVLFEYLKVKNGESISIETLERVNNPSSLRPVITEQVPEATGAAEEKPESVTRPRIPVAKERQKYIRAGQTGISYKNLFTDYLKGAKEITLEDPYIRVFFQVSNFVEFMTMITEELDTEDMKVHLKTYAEDSEVPDLIDDFDEIAVDVQQYGIEFTYEFADFHERRILTDTGWTITMGRGLDIYEKPASKFSIATKDQNKRKCRDFAITYTKK